MKLIWTIAFAATLVLGFSGYAAADDTQPHIVLTPAQPAAMRPFDVDAYFVGPPGAQFTISAVAEDLREINAGTLTVCGSTCQPQFQHFHVTVPGVRTGTYRLKFVGLGDFQSFYAAFDVIVTTDFVITPGVEGSFFDQNYYGQGFNFEGLVNNQLLVYFYTFTPQGNNLFLTGVGSYSGHIATVPLATSTGGKFDVSSAATASPWGTLTVDFSDCNSAEATWTVNADSKAAGYNDSGLPFVLARIASNPNLHCP